jgi:aspartate racemase
MLGILGITPPATLYFVKYLHDLSDECISGNHSPLYHLRMENPNTYLTTVASRKKDWVGMMVDAVSQMIDLGVSRVVCPANSNHSVYDDVCSLVGNAWIHIADPVLARLNQLGLRRVMVLGTSVTVADNIYGSRYQSEPIEVVYLTDRLQNELHKAIVSELVFGHQGVLISKVLIDLKAELDSSECDGIILGCTELTMVEASLANFELPIVDSCRELAKFASSLVTFS